MPRKKSVDILRDKSLYKSIAFTRAERKRLGLEGLLPHAVATQAQLVSRVMESLRRVPRDIDKYMALSSLQERNERAVLPHGDRSPRRDHAVDLHAHRRRGVPGVFAHRAGAEGLLHHAGRPRPHREDSRQLAREGHPRHRRHRRAADPGPRRPGRQRHGDSHRQTRALHRVRGHPAEALPAGDARRGHEQRGTAARTSCTSATRASGWKARRTSTSSKNSCGPCRRSTRARCFSSRTF